MSHREFNPDKGIADDLVDYPTEVNAAHEDREADNSESTGRIPKSEVDALHANGAETIEQRTRGVRNNAMKPEQDLDEALKQEGAIGPDGEESLEYGSV